MNVARIIRITAYNYDPSCDKYRNYRTCPDGIKYQSDCGSGNSIECEGWSEQQLISMAGLGNIIYFNGELVHDPTVPAVQIIPEVSDTPQLIDDTLADVKKYLTPGRIIATIVIAIIISMLKK